MARIHMAKNASGNAYLSSKKKIEELILAHESGLEMEDLKGGEVFELQHHHLLTCLEKTTVSSVSGLGHVTRPRTSHVAGGLPRLICPTSLPQTAGFSNIRPTVMVT